MTAWYNEIEPFAADWLENLEKEKLVAAGLVDRRSIVDIEPADLDGYDQCHFFAGIGGWSLSLKIAGWPDGVPVWTGSCPCQPFSAAGRGRGFSDDRHLWPSWFRLIREYRPGVVLGEQVASKAGLEWLDVVRDDLEGAGYAVGATTLPSCSVGAPHIRQRLWFVAVSESIRRREGIIDAGSIREAGQGRASSTDGGGLLGVADAEEVRRGQGRPGRAGDERRRIGRSVESGRPRAPGDMAITKGEREGRLHLRPRGSREQISDTVRSGEVGELANTVFTGRAEGRPESGDGSVTGSGVASKLANADGERRQSDERRKGSRRQPLVEGLRELGDASREGGGRDAGEVRRAEEGGEGAGREPRRVADEPFPAGATRGHWDPADWVWCRDDKWRPVEPGSFPLAHGVPARVGKLRAYGNAINPLLAAEFIRCAWAAIEEVIS